MTVTHESTPLELLTFLREWFTNSPRETQLLYLMAAAVRGPDSRTPKGYGEGITAKRKFTARIRATLFGPYYGTPITTPEEAHGLLEEVSAARRDTRDEHLNHFYQHLQDALGAFEKALAEERPVAPAGQRHTGVRVDRFEQ